MADKPKELKEYKVMLNGQPTTVQLTEEDYEKQGWVDAEDPDGYATKGEKKGSKLTTSESTKARKPSNKARDEEANK